MSEYRRQQAWTAGKKAALAGKSRETCKRVRGTIFFDDWHDGYNSGERHLLIEKARKAAPPGAADRISGDALALRYGGDLSKMREMTADPIEPMNFSLPNGRIA